MKTLYQLGFGIGGTIVLAFAMHLLAAWFDRRYGDKPGTGEGMAMGLSMVVVVLICVLITTTVLGFTSILDATVAVAAGMIIPCVVLLVLLMILGRAGARRGYDKG